MEPDISVFTPGQVWLGLNSNNCTAASLQPGLLTEMFLFCPSFLCNPLTSSGIRSVTDSKTSSAEEHLTIGCVCSQAEVELKRPQIPLAEGTLPGEPQVGRSSASLAARSGAAPGEEPQRGDRTSQGARSPAFNEKQMQSGSTPATEPW